MRTNALTVTRKAKAEHPVVTHIGADKPTWTLGMGYALRAGTERLHTILRSRGRKIMPCNSDYCDLHDYPVASPWCEYKWQMEQRGKRASREAEAHDRIMDLIDKREYLDQGYTERRKEPVKAVVPAKKNTGATYQWNK
jgi:hypothetical protein